MNWNLDIVETLAQNRSDWGVAFFSRFTEFGGTAIVIVAAVAAILVLWYGKRWAHAVGLIVALGGSLAVAEILKFLVREARPPVALHAIFESGYSFPSNHATAAMALYGFLAWSLWDISAKGRTIVVALAAAMILLIGYSRVYLGVHYPLDVIGGYILGAAFLYLGARITKKLERFEG